MRQILISKEDFKSLNRWIDLENRVNLTVIPAGKQLLLEGTQNDFLNIVDMLTDELMSRGIENNSSINQIGYELERLIDLITDAAFE
ncbi:hypothetical protein [Solirubrum puertoriconensis]|uniref:Uncharacterized protein n=1 Tax=Solirubrum puertoriconensis TaxID=1751427 RepID=A0A9X0HI80_SOLP1|nr:hypothetical protein [Solirubrum puertoriconensis]KUG06363.1 hypothetical protein ASU33_03125 [Solirubrum puertoriconensis]